MTKRIANLSDGARKAIQSTGTSRQGATPRGRFAPEILAELAEAKLLGRNGGLTRQGSYAYLDIQDAIMADFPA